MFENVTQKYDASDATWEILLMLLGAFILGYLLRYFISKARYSDLEGELDTLRRKNNSLQSDLDECRKKKVTAAKVTPAKVAAVSAVAAPVKPSNPDDLKKVEGIGPKIESILNAGGIWTWSALADASQERLTELLHEAFPGSLVHKPGTWPEQAAMARDGKFDELKKWQDELKGGV